MGVRARLGYANRIWKAALISQYSQKVSVLFPYIQYTYITYVIWSKTMATPGHMANRYLAISDRYIQWLKVLIRCVLNYYSGVPLQRGLIYHGTATRAAGLKSNIKLTKTHHTSLSRAIYGVPIVRILKTNDHIIAAPHCISDSYCMKRGSSLEWSMIESINSVYHS